jgi:hypothetical protein
MLGVADMYTNRKVVDRREWKKDEYNVIDQEKEEMVLVLSSVHVVVGM